MRSTRPPRRLLTVLAFAWAAVSGTTGVIHAQNLNLPDLVLPGNLRPDIILPADDRNLTDPWTVRPLRHRRLYPVAAVISPDVPPVPVGITGLGSMDAVNGRYVSPSIDGPGESSTWSASAGYDIQEGLSLSVGRSFGDVDRLEAEVFLPLAISPARPWQTGLDWNRTGAVSGAMKAGGKYSDGAVAYGLADFRWDRPFGSPDSYELLVQSHGGSRGGIGGRLGIRLEIPVSDTGWQLGAILGGGGSFDASGGDWQADAGMYSGFRASEGRLQLVFGLQGHLQPDRNLGLNPLVHLIWRPGNAVTLFAASEYDFGTKGTDSIIQEQIDSFEAEIPVSTVYRLGTALGREGRAVTKLTVSAGYGRFAFGGDEAVFLRDDVRAGFDASTEIPIGDGTVSATGGLDWYFDEERVIWLFETAWKVPAFSIYVNAGSEDALLGGGLPGIRGELPIIGIGSDLKIGRRWTAGLYAYTGLPRISPSLAISAGWRN